MPMKANVEPYVLRECASNLENLHVLTRVLCRRPVATTVGTEVAVNMLGNSRCSFAYTQD